MTHQDQAVPAVAELPPPTVGDPQVPAAPALDFSANQPGATRKRIELAIGLALALGLGYLVFAKVLPALHRPDDRLLQIPRTTVAKVDLNTVLTAFGRVESSSNTVISCELERLEMRARGGRSVSSGGASTILTLVDEGTNVKKGDVLAQLDASEYEELVRTQEIKTQQAEAARRTAELNFEVAEISVTEFRNGLYDQQLQSFEGSIALSESDVERSGDRLKWTEKMLGKGYASIATKATEARKLAQSQLDVLTSKMDLSNFLEYGSKKTLMELSSEVEKRRFELIANTMRVTRNRDQLALYKRMVDLCTIKAPHDGFLIYASDPWRPTAGAIEPGQTVRQGQKLFFLPDLGKMEVMAYIHESVATQVRGGMRAKALIEGLQNRSLEGHVVSVAPLPTNAGNWWSDDVKYFVGVVKLDTVPIGLKPGMTAEIEFEVDRLPDVLAVSSEAVAVENGRNICYVAGADGLERRPVSLGKSTRDLLEVKRGLAEGDQVVLRPDRLENIDELLVHHDAGPSSTEEATASAPSGDTGGPISVE